MKSNSGVCLRPKHVEKMYIYGMSAVNKGGYSTTKLPTVAYASKQGQQHVSCKWISPQSSYQQWRMPQNHCKRDKKLLFYILKT
jgi:hypothetical protein